MRMHQAIIAIPRSERSRALALLATGVTLCLLLVGAPLYAKPTQAMTPLDPWPYRLEEEAASAQQGQAALLLSKRLPRRSVARVLSDANRRAAPRRRVPGVGRVARGFVWNAADRFTQAWYPQGISGAWDSGTRASSRHAREPFDQGPERDSRPRE